MQFRKHYTGLIETYRDRLPVSDDTRIISLGEGDTPLIRLENIPGLMGKDVNLYVKYEGLNPTGSFNLVSRLHNTPQVNSVLELLVKGKKPNKEKHHLFKLNHELFLFSAGNMGDLQHIILSETMRFGWFEHGPLKYFLAVILLLPAHLILTPFMLMSSRKFFIFTPLRFIKKFGSFYGEVKEMTIDLQNHHNLIELDGDVVTIEENLLHIRPVGYIDVVTK